MDNKFLISAKQELIGFNKKSDSIWIKCCGYIKVIIGNIEINGYNASAVNNIDNLLILSHECFGLLPLKVLTSNMQQISPKELIKAENIELNDELHSWLKKFDTIVLYTKYIPNYLLILDKTNGITDEFEVFDKTKNKNPFCLIFDELLSLNNELSSKKIKKMVVIGPKSVGKSTWIRFVINYLLNKNIKIYLLDCDVGQSEMNPPCNISLNLIEKPLFGPQFTHLREPIQSFFYPCTTSLIDPTRYVRTIEKLYYIFESYSSKNSILVVNTQGWIYDLGNNLLSDILNIISPSHIFGLYSQQNNSNYFKQNTLFMDGWMRNYNQTSFNLIPIKSLKPVLKHKNNISSKVFRKLSWYSYLSNQNPIFKFQNPLSCDYMDMFKIKQLCLDKVSIDMNGYRNSVDLLETSIKRCLFGLFTSKNESNSFEYNYIGQGLILFYKLEKNIICFVSPINEDFINSIVHIKISSEKLPHIKYQKALKSIYNNNSSIIGNENLKRRRKFSSKISDVI